MMDRAEVTRYRAQSTLHTTLEDLLAIRHGNSRRIVALHRRRSPFASSHGLDELDVVLDDGERLRLLCKDVTRSGMLEAAQQAKPSFLAHARREIEMYRTVLASCGDAVPGFVGELGCHEPRRARLVIECVAGLELRRVGEVAVWETAMRSLALLHSRAIERFKTLAVEDLPPLLLYDHEFYRQWPARAGDVAERLPARYSTDGRRELRRLASRYELIADVLAGLPRGVIHGDCFPSNVIVETGSGVARICFVDWEMAAIGSPLIDVAALTAGAWSDHQRERFIGAYRAALDDAGCRPPSLDELLYQLTHCRLHLALQLLGWSSNWQPPSEQDQDWLGEALRLAEALNYR